MLQACTAQYLSKYLQALFPPFDHVMLLCLINYLRETEVVGRAGGLAGWIYS